MSEGPNKRAEERRVEDTTDPEAEVSTAKALGSGADMLDHTRESSNATRRRRIFHGGLATLMLFAAGAATDVEARHHSHDRGRARIIIEREPRRPPPPRYYVERRVVVVERPILAPIMDRLERNLQERSFIKDQATRDAGAAYRTGAREPNPPVRYAAPVQQRYYENAYVAIWRQLQEQTPRVDPTPVPTTPSPGSRVAPLRPAIETTPRPTPTPEASVNEQEVLQQIRSLAEQAAKATIAGGRDYDDRPEAHGFSREQMRIFTTNSKARRDAFGTLYHDLVTRHYQQQRQEKPRPAQGPDVAQPPTQGPDRRPAQGPAPGPLPSHTPQERPAGDQRHDPIIRIR